MSGQDRWDGTGASNRNFIVSFQKMKELFQKAQFPTIVGRISGKGEIIRMPQGSKIASIDLAGSTCIREKEITTGNEARMTFVDDPVGMAKYGDAAVVTGNYKTYKHQKCWINQVDSEALPLPGRCSLKMVNDVITDPKSDVLADRLRWAGEEMDYDFIRACLRGASRGILAAVADGGLYEKLYDASTGGTIRSAQNFYGANGGFATASATIATHETNCGTRLSALSDNALYGFDIGEHRKMREAVKTKRFKRARVGGQEYDSFCLIDPDLLWRLATDSTYTSLMSAAALRGKDNPAINMMEPIVLDGIAYCPYERLKAFRPSVANSVPVYGAADTYDPRTYANTQKICLAIYMGADAVARCTDKTVWPTTEEGEHQKGVEIAVHYDDGFTRIEPGTYDGSTAALESNSMIVGAWYDPGVGVSFAA